MSAIEHKKVGDIPTRTSLLTRTYNVTQAIAVLGSKAATYLALGGMSMIAIVDDDEDVRQATKSLLRSLGYRVATFATAEEFLNSDQLQEISCVITDVQMPGISGIELLARLKAEGHRFPVMVITAFPNDRRP